MAGAFAAIENAVPPANRPVVQEVNPIRRLLSELEPTLAIPQIRVGVLGHIAKKIIYLSLR